MAVEERTYRLEPLDTSGVFLGLGIVQSGLLGAGIVVAVLAISAGVPALAALAPLVAAGTVSFARVRGHPAWEWLPLGAGWWWAGLVRGRRWMPPLPLWPTDAGKPPPLPPCLAGLEVVPVPWRAMADLAAVADAQAGSLTAVVPVSGAQFALEPRSEQERLLAGWGEVLAQFATEQTAVTHLSWSDLARPGGLDQHRSWMDQRDRAALPAAAASYDELVDLGATAATVHDVVATVTVSRQRLGHRRGNHDELLQRALTSAVDALARGLRAAGLGVGDPLGIGGLHRLLRLRSDPTLAGAGRHAGRLADRLGLVTATSAGPLVVDTAWRHVRVDDAWHRTYWVANWPRLAMPPSWLEPFLSATGVTRAMTVVFVPVPTHQSRRRIERDLVKLQSDADVKEQKGRRIDARHHQATTALLEREQELVAGFAEMSYVGLVTVTAAREDGLDEHAEILEQRAAESGMELRVLDGRQDVAWAAALPLGLAPRTLLA